MITFGAPVSARSMLSLGRSTRRPVGSPRPVRVAAVGAVLVAVAAAVEVGGTDDGVSICAVRHATGGYCPGCGATRAARHLLHGDLSSGWADHPWVVLAAVQLVVLVVAATVAGIAAALAARRSRLPRPPGSLGVSRVAFVVVGTLNVLLLLGVWAVRLATGEIPSPI